MLEENGLYIAIGAGVVALIFAAVLARRVLNEDQGNDTMKDIGTAIQEGAMAFLGREYRTLAVFVIVVAAIMAFLPELGVEPAIAYVVGAVCSATTGFLGMSIAIRANTRTAAAASVSLNTGLRVAFSSGAVMGTSVVGIGILGISILYIIFQDINTVAAFGFGASSIALFARVGGGIFTKAADVGSDIVGKVEAGIPEDDPRNPATIADNVGDNVGDVAGMGSDLFESYSSSIIATIAIGTAAATSAAYDAPLLVLPLVIAGVGIIASLIGTFFVSTGGDASMSKLLWALRKGIYVSSALVVVASYAVITLMDIDNGTGIFVSILVGLIAGNVIGFSTEYYTSYEYSPTKKISEAAQTGAGTTIIVGFATGMMSTVVPVISVIAAILIAHNQADLYGVAIAAVGMLSTLGITLATDAYGPVADNAGGIAEQAGLDPEVRERTDALDSLGNTTAATGKGFAIGSAALTSLALLSAYSLAIMPDGGFVINILEPSILVGLFIGALLPFVFSALTMQAVGTAAYAIVEEVRRQFREIPGIMEYKAGKTTGRPDYARCVDISTQGSLKAMILPGAMAVIAPVAVGRILGPEELGAMLVGSIASGFLLAVTMANAGGAWDNAKKYIEAGNFGGKNTETHKAAVTGDTVGDPFKDTSGPALNILIKLMSIVALVFAPIFIS